MRLRLVMVNPFSMFFAPNGTFVWVLIHWLSETGGICILYQEITIKLPKNNDLQRNLQVIVFGNKHGGGGES